MIPVRPASTRSSLQAGDPGSNHLQRTGRTSWCLHFPESRSSQRQGLDSRNRALRAYSSTCRRSSVEALGMSLASNGGSGKSKQQTPHPSHGLSERVFILNPTGAILEGDRVRSEIVRFSIARADTDVTRFAGPVHHCRPVHPEIPAAAVVPVGPLPPALRGSDHRDVGTSALAASPKAHPSSCGGSIPSARKRIQICLRCSAPWLTA